MSLNLFKKELTDIHHGLYSTRVYVLLLGIAVIILTVYSSIIQNTQSITVHNPTLTQFEQLHAQYVSTLSCPCRDLSVAYTNIMTIRPIFHQVCSSTFIREDGWLRYWPLEGTSEWTSNSPVLSAIDFRSIGQVFFQLLQMYCDLASEIVMNALDVFDSTQFISAQSLGRDNFYVQTSTLLRRFQEQVNHILTCVLSLLLFSFNRQLDHLFRCSNSLITQFV